MSPMIFARAFGGVGQKNRENKLSKREAFCANGLAGVVRGREGELVECRPRGLAPDVLVDLGLAVLLLDHAVRDGLRAALHAKRHRVVPEPAL